MVVTRRKRFQDYKEHGSWERYNVPVYLSGRDIEALCRILAKAEQAATERNWPRENRPGRKPKARTENGAE